MVAAVNTKSDAKKTFKSLLIEHKGEITPEVKEALENLVQLSANERGGDGDAEWSPAFDLKINRGRWRSITTPPFPGKLHDDDDDADGRSRFTLGRMSFGMFKPTKIVCAVDEIINIVEQLIKNEEGDNQQGRDGDIPAWTQSYIMEALIDIETSSSTKLPARIVTCGVCWPQSPTRLGVTFNRGTLEPRFDLSSPENVSLSALWKETFHNVIAKEAEARSYLGKFGTYLMHLLMKGIIGLAVPMDSSDFTQTYSMESPFAGHSDILYIDEDLRVSRGNKGTISVVERIA